MSAPVSFIEWCWSKDCRLKSTAHARSVYEIALFVYERFCVDGWKRYVNDDRLRVDGDKNMRLLTFAFTIVFVWTGPKTRSGCKARETRARILWSSFFSSLAKDGSKWAKPKQTQNIIDTKWKNRSIKSKTKKINQ